MASPVQHAMGILVLLAAGLALFGWGRALLRLARLQDVAGPVTVALGLAAALAVGGILNVVGVAFSQALWAMVAAGWLFAVARMRDIRLPAMDVESGLAGVFIAAVGVFAISTQLPPALFNHYDDLEKYFAHPVRMLATGTLLGSPLSALGSESLGGAAFLQAFVLSLFPIGYINGVDAVFGFVLLLCLGASAGRRRPGVMCGALLVPLLLASVEPQYVNVSSSYAAAALMAAAVMISADAPGGEPAPIVLGFLYAGLVALKPTFGLFAAFHLPLTALAMGVAGGSWRRAAIWAARAGAWSAVTIAPWLALHASHYASAPLARTEAIGDSVSENLQLWSVGPGAYGASIAHYTLLALLGLAAAGLSYAASRDARASRWHAASLAASVLVAPLSWALLVLVLSPVLSGRDTSLRYAIPFLLGIVPVAFTCSAALLPTPKRALWSTLVLSGLAIAFLPATLERYASAIEHRSILAYLNPAVARAPEFRGYFRAALSERTHHEIRQAQQLVPTGEPLLAWVLTPFHLDFARNPIIDVDPAGLSMYWARLPGDVRYVMWERRGWPVRSDFQYSRWAQSAGRRERTIAERARAFAGWLESQRLAGEVLHDSGGLVLFRLSVPSQNPKP